MGPLPQSCALLRPHPGGHLDILGRTPPGLGLASEPLRSPRALGWGGMGLGIKAWLLTLPALDWAAARLLWLRTGRAQGADSGTSLLGGCCGLAPPVWSVNCTCGWEEINPLQLPLWRRFLIQGWPSPPGLGTPSPPLLVTELVSIYPISASEPRVWSPYIRACCPSNGVTCF